jgi:hypothetical protein
MVSSCSERKNTYFTHSFITKHLHFSPPGEARMGNSAIDLWTLKLTMQEKGSL